ncbi:MAG TPA: SpoIIE family protein phosphatase, partial [Streptomyces sp.]
MLGLVVLIVAAASVLLVLHQRRDSTQEARTRTLDIAEAVAHNPGLVAALDSRNPTAVLQPLMEGIRARTGIGYIVVANRNGIRYTHPDPALIGKHITGPYKEALQGHAFTRTFEGSRGPAVDSVVPVSRADGTVAGVVSVGITIRMVNAVADRELPLLIGAALAAFALAAGGAALLSRRLSRQTRGLGPQEMTRMYEHHDAVLHAVREGVLIIGADKRLLLANDEARRLLDLPSDAVGRPVTEAGLDTATAELLVSGEAVTDELRAVGDRLIAVNLRDAGVRGGPSGMVATLRDTTELRSLAGKAEGVRKRLLLLYEASAQVGTTLDASRTARELADIAVPRFADHATVDLAESVLRGDEPESPAAAVGNLRRAAVAGLSGDHPFHPIGRTVTFDPGTPPAVGVSGGHAVLVPDLSTNRDIWGQITEHMEEILAYGVHSLLSVPLHARGVILGVANFWRAQKPEGFAEDDVSFAEELVARAAVCVDNARRYTREHEMAVTLQRSLLPRGMPEQNALDAAYRYLPAQAGVGGDWFDVIPLPGTRVALVVGDVVGHGLHAAATMGRLRTAVQNFSTLDLPPDELLARVDELVSGMDQEERGVGDGGEISGATCLYAVYDPVAGSCSIARAGHPAPALVLPDGSVELPDIPVGLPLGLGGMPYEAADIRVPEGSRLVLYTNGLIETRDRDVDAGLEMLRSVLSGRVRTPEELCAEVLATM